MSISSIVAVLHSLDHYLISYTNYLTTTKKMVKQRINSQQQRNCLLCSQHAHMFLQRRGGYIENILTRSTSYIACTDRHSWRLWHWKGSAGPIEEAQIRLGIWISRQGLPFEFISIANWWDGLFRGRRCGSVQCRRTIATALHRPYGWCEKVRDR